MRKLRPLGLAGGKSPKPVRVPHAPPLVLEVTSLLEDRQVAARCVDRRDPEYFTCLRGSVVSWASR